MLDGSCRPDQGQIRGEFTGQFFGGIVRVLRFGQKRFVVILVSKSQMTAPIKGLLPSTLTR